MAIEDVDHARAAAAQEKIGRPVTPDDVAAHLGRRGVQLRLDLSGLDEPEIEPEAAVEAPPRRRGRPPKVRTDA